MIIPRETVLRIPILFPKTVFDYKLTPALCRYNDLRSKRIYRLSVCLRNGVCLYILEMPASVK